MPPRHAAPRRHLSPSSRQRPYAAESRSSSSSPSKSTHRRRKQTPETPSTEAASAGSWCVSPTSLCCPSCRRTHDEIQGCARACPLAEVDSTATRQTLCFILSYGIGIRNGMIFSTMHRAPSWGGFMMRGVPVACVAVLDLFPEDLRWHRVPSILHFWFQGRMGRDGWHGMARHLASLISQTAFSGRKSLSRKR
jgi:hypothetical protein